LSIADGRGSKCHSLSGMHFVSREWTHGAIVGGREVMSVSLDRECKTVKLGPRRQARWPSPKFKRIFVQSLWDI
jgi:hypothetical protein